MTGKFDRLLRILNLLDQDNSCTLSGLAEELGVTDRSVLRYMKSLNEAGFPIVFDKDRGTYAFTDGFKLKKARLNVDETLALAMAKKLLSTLGQTFDRAFESLETKVLEVAKPRTECLPSSAFVVTGQEKTEGKDISKLLKDLAKAAVEHCLVHLTYESLYAEEITERDIEPYYLFFSSDGFWNLRAYCRFREGWRTFALDRVRAWQLLERYFVPRIFADEVGKEISQGFGTYLDGEPVKVAVRFSPEIKPYVTRKTWHPSQENKDLANGWVEMRFVTTGIEAVKHWLYRWIPHVRVIEPDELRREMIEDLKKQKDLLGK
ncbi:MAG: WYL domain-containing protein [Syntrophobacteraceae bacterium]|nr:WYL domain-containing protein [Syntrophobacteraceae bacterium]